MFKQYGLTHQALNEYRQPGKGNDPDVKEAERKMIKAALKAGIAPRVEIGSFNKDVFKEYMDLGVKHFSVGWDVEII